MEKIPNNLLRHAREERSWSQSRLAEELGVEEQTVRSWERGARFPSPKFRSRLCEVFGMTLEQLGLQRSQEPSQSIDLPRASPSPATIDAIYHDVAPPPERVFLPKQIDKNRRSMLKRVHSTWIDGVLEHSLHNAVFITLGLQEQSDALANPWHLQIQDMDKAPRPLPKGTHIMQVYDEADGELLILGEPGAGKTTLLLELTRYLLNRAEQDEKQRIPVIFNLSSWGIRQQSLEEWLIEELYSKYRVPLRIGKEWLKTNQLIILLDGLDEVNGMMRSSCAQAINTYQKIDEFISIVVCCRRSEYFQQETRIVLRQAVLIQPLTIEQVNNYLSTSKQMEEVRKAFLEDGELYEMIKTPLMLNIVVLTSIYQGDVQQKLYSATASAETRRQQIFATYVHHMLNRRGMTEQYTQTQTIQWLAWMASQMQQHNQTEFYIERMQPDWLPTDQLRRQHFHTVTRIMYGITYVLTAALFSWLRGGKSSRANGIGEGLFGLLGARPGNSILQWMAPGIGGGLTGSGALGLIFGLGSILVSILISSATSTTTLQKYTVWLPWKDFLQRLFKGTLSGFKTGSIVGGIITCCTTLLVSPTLGFPASIIEGMTFGLVGGLNVGLLAGLLAGMYEKKPLDQEKEHTLRRMRGNHLDYAIDALVIGTSGGLSFGLISIAISGLRIGLTYGLIVSIFGTLLVWIDRRMNNKQRLDLGITIKPSETIFWSWQPVFRGWAHKSTQSMVVGLSMMISVILMIGLASSLIHGLSYGIIYGLVYGLIIGLTVGIAGILTGILDSGWSSDLIDEHQLNHPNEGIRRSACNSLIAALLVGPIGGLACGAIVGLAFGLIGRLSDWFILGTGFAIAFGALFAINMWDVYGGVACIEHYLLRWSLWRLGAMPMNYVCFLDYAAERILLRKIGGGYIFVHRLLLDYFAELAPVSSSPSKKEETQQR